MGVRGEDPDGNPLVDSGFITHVSDTLLQDFLASKCPQSLVTLLWKNEEVDQEG